MSFLKRKPVMRDSVFFFSLALPLPLNTRQERPPSPLTVKTHRMTRPFSKRKWLEDPGENYGHLEGSRPRIGWLSSFWGTWAHTLRSVVSSVAMLMTKQPALPCSMAMSAWAVGAGGSWGAYSAVHHWWTSAAAK